jgi:tight adherence protein B
VTPRLLRALGALLLGTLAVLCAALGAPGAYAADTGATIEHAQPTSDGVRLLVSVPPGNDSVDPGKISVTIGGEPVKAEAQAASQSNAIERTSILAIDTSDSMRGARITEAKKAAGAYLDAAPANVRIGVLTFDDTVKVLVPPGLDRGAARTAIAGLTLTRNTALYDGVLGALDAAGPKGDDAGQRRILVLSDGKDTTGTSLSEVIKAIKESGATVDAVSLQQSDAESGPLRAIAAAGKGTVLNAAEPAALSAAFASEADALARQIVVTAAVPEKAKDSDNVSVSVPVGTTTLTAAAYLPVRSQDATKSPTLGLGPAPVQSGRFDLPQGVVFGGVAAIGIGVLGVIVVLAMGRPPASSEDRIGEQMRAYGMYATPGQGATGAPNQPAAPLSLAGQARLAAEKALANNRSLEARIAVRLEAAGMALKPAEWLLIRAGVAVVAGLVGALIGSGSIILGLIFLVAGVVGPGIYLRLKRSRRLNAFGTGLADTLQLMSGSLSAGLSLAQSIDTIVREGQEPITSEFKRVVVESRLGVPLEDSLEGVAARMESRDFEWVVMAIRIQREVGGNLAELLLTVADTLREREYLRRHVRALSAEGRLSCYILGALPPGFLLYLTVSKPTYTHPMYTTPIGWLMCGAMVLLLSVGIFWMSKVAKVDV